MGSQFPAPTNYVILPFLPGNSFHQHKEKHHKHSAFEYVNGYRIPRTTQLMHQLPENLSQLASLDPAFTYGYPKYEITEKFVPAQCAFDNKVLRFFGFMKEATHFNPDEIYRVRKLTIHYFLDDNTIMVMEKNLPNSGMNSGRLLHRQRIPKNLEGDLYHWTDLSVGITVDFYGKAIRIVDCDKWTAEFLLSEGIELGDVEAIPPDPYTDKKVIERPAVAYVVAPTNLKTHKFLTFDRQVLRFYCIWDARHRLYGDIKPYVLLFYLADDTIEVHEIRTPNDGCDPIPSLIRRQQIVKSFKNKPNDIPSIILEPTDADFVFYTCEDLSIGKTIDILGRKFLLYDCDQFTKDFYYKHYGITDFTPVDVKMPKKIKVTKIIPPHKGWGSPVDSFQSCLKVAPIPPRKNVLWQMQHAGVVFKYAAKMDSVHEVDQKRKFIVQLYVSDDTIAIIELPVDGFMGGPFLRRQLLQKVDSDPNNPTYYRIEDLSVGRGLETFGHKFLLTDEDRFIALYKASHPESFPTTMRIVSANPNQMEYKFETDEESNRLCIPRTENAQEVM
uniref:DM10 domain-containing protein n=1 Tax=Strigamia maritima TaxID=126957 RepID=T1JFE1_STRMM